MTLPIKLSDVVAGIDVPSEEWTVYLNKRTGEIVPVSYEDAEFDEDESERQDAPDWPLEQLPKIREALESEDYLALSDKFEIHKWSIMERFTRTIEDPFLHDRLDRAIRGSGAFRHFKGVLDDFGIRDQWYTFRNSAFEEIAVDWLEENGIPFERNT